jgi:MarR family transcriptional regulator, organic hydroperoxide resistance regulator
MGRLDPKLVEEAEAILAQVRTLWRDLLRNPFAEAEQHGLTGPQVRVMACLVSRGPLAVTELSRTVGMNHSTASGIVDRLQSRGLVRRMQDASDRRRTRIAVTDKVTKYVSELEEGPAGQLAAALKSASPEQRRAIRRGLTLLADALRARRTPQGP